MISMRWPSPSPVGRPASGNSTRNTASSSLTKLLAARFPREFIPPIEAGIREALDNGVLAGFTMVDVAVVLIDGSYHDVDSNEMAFKIAGSMAFKEACARAKAVCWNPS